MLALLGSFNALAEGLEVDSGKEVFAQAVDSKVIEEEIWLAPSEEAVDEEETVEVQAPTSNNSIAKASAIGISGSYSGSIDELNQGNFYRLELPSSGELTIDTTGQLEFIHYSVFDSDGNRLYEHLLMWNAAAKQSQLTISLDLNKGVYYFCAQELYGRFGNYSFTTHFESAKESFEEHDNGTDNTRDKANDASCDQEYTGLMAINDAVDYYRFTVPKAGRITLSANWQIYSVTFRLYDEAGTRIWDKWYVTQGSDGEGDALETIDLLSGTYYMEVERYRDKTGIYTFNLKYADSDETFRDDRLDDAFETANRIDLETVYMGQLAINEERDFYHFDLQKETEVTFNVSAYCEYITLSLYDSNGIELWKNGLSWNSTTKRITSEKTATLPAGEYYACISKYYGKTGNYSLLIKGNVEPDKVVLNKEGTVTLKMGKTLQLKATLSPSPAKSKLMWSSTKEKTARVDQNGLVTPVKAGTATIAVVTENGKLDSVKVKVVNVGPNAIKITKGKAATMKVGKTLKLKTKLSPTYAVTTLKWSTSNKNVATVTQKGVVKAKKAGKAKITVKAANGRKATITITVKKK